MEQEHHAVYDGSWPIAIAPTIFISYPTNLICSGHAHRSQERRDAEQIGMEQQQDAVREQADRDDGQVIR